MEKARSIVLSVNKCSSVCVLPKTAEVKVKPLFNLL